MSICVPKTNNMSKVQILLDNSGGAATQKTLETLQKYLDENPKIREIVVLPNVGNVKNASSLPTGTITLVEENTAMNPALLPKSIMSVLTLYEISKKNDEVLDDRHFTPEKIQSVLKEILGEGPSLDNAFVGHCDPNIKGRDSKSWKPALGKSGWVAISKYEPRRFENTYYIAVFSSNDTISDQMVDIADSMSLQTDIHAIDGAIDPPSISKFMAREEYGLARVIARRNNDKIAIRLAEALSLNVNRTADDVDGLVNAKTHKLDVVAIPDFVTYFGQISTARLQYKQNVDTVVAIYDNCTKVTGGAGNAVVPLNPIDGIALFEKLPSSTVFATGQPFGCLPCGTGKSDEHRSLDSAQRKYISNCVHWEGKITDQMHHKVTRQYRSVDAVLKVVPSERAIQKRLEHVFTTLPEE